MAAGGRGSEQLMVPGAAWRGAAGYLPFDCVDGIFRHCPVNRPFAAKHTDQAAARFGFDLVVTRNPASLAHVLRWLDEWTETGNRTYDVSRFERPRQIAIEMAKQVFGFFTSNSQILIGAGFGFRSPHKEAAKPRNGEDHAAIVGGRNQQRVLAQTAWQG